MNLDTSKHGLWSPQGGSERRRAWQAYSLAQPRRWWTLIKDDNLPFVSTHSVLPPWWFIQSLRWNHDDSSRARKHDKLNFALAFSSPRPRFLGMSWKKCRRVATCLWFGDPESWHCNRANIAYKFSFKELLQYLLRFPRPTWSTYDHIIEPKGEPDKIEKVSWQCEILGVLEAEQVSGSLVKTARRNIEQWMIDPFSMLCKSETIHSSVTSYTTLAGVDVPSYY